MTHRTTESRHGILPAFPDTSLALAADRVVGGRAWQLPPGCVLDVFDSACKACMSLRRSRQTARRWLRDGQGRLISATMSNLFAEVGGALMTPALERCRGPGVARAAGWAVYLQARVVQLCIDPLSAAGTAFPGSSVRGILPVQSCGEWNEACWVVARRLQPHGLNLGLVMEQGG